MAYKLGNTIVTDGLALYLDAGNRVSYPGSGTAWYDLSGNQNHFTLYNTPTYTGNGITFNINGASQYADCINNTFGNFGSSSFTLEYVFNLVPAASSRTTMWFSSLFAKRAAATNITDTGKPGWTYNPGGSGTDGTYGGLFSCMDSAGTVVNNSTTYLGNIAPENTNIHVTHTVERNGINITASYYTNATYVTRFQYTASGDGLFNNALYATLMKSGNGQYRSGSLYQVRAYTKLLTTTEITQNYNAQRWRFNI